MACIRLFQQTLFIFTFVLWKKHIQINNQKATYFKTLQIVGCLGGWVDKPEHYPYSSARNNSDMECLIEIDMIR